MSGAPSSRSNSKPSLFACSWTGAISGVYFWKESPSRHQTSAPAYRPGLRELHRNARRKSQIIFSMRRRSARLASKRTRIEHQDRQTLGCCIHGRSESCSRLRQPHVIGPVGKGPWKQTQNTDDTFSWGLRSTGSIRTDGGSSGFRDSRRSIRCAASASSSGSSIVYGTHCASENSAIVAIRCTTRP